MEKGGRKGERRRGGGGGGGERVGNGREEGGRERDGVDVLSTYREETHTRVQQMNDCADNTHTEGMIRSKSPVRLLRS